MTIPELECCLCASIMDEPTAKLGPNICTALSSTDYWESPEAIKVAGGIKRAIEEGRPTHRRVVQQYIHAEYIPWLNHRLFKEGLPMSCMDFEVLTVLDHYRNKRLIAIMGDAYFLAHGKPENAPQIATRLKEQLEEAVCK